MPQHTNRLAAEKSPYLLQHAHNPVDWYPWGPEAFEKARTEDRPVFLSVGYSACHWCHVMERESFENEAIAAILNEHFVSIKVDREERPDIDDLYMNAVQMMTGQGGWPMSVFLLPDGRPFYGGTYFPPENRHGRIGFPSLVQQLAEAYVSRRSDVEQIAESMASELRNLSRQKPPESGSLYDTFEDRDTLLETAVADLEERFDSEYGGFGGAPKFPPHHSLRLLCTAVRLGGNEIGARAARMLYTTLDRMALSGIHDHIGGGFHRYATDAQWHLPHFEKMLYDNALLARVYAEAAQLSGKLEYLQMAERICHAMLQELYRKDGSGFFAALDADSEGEEGKYYVWTPEEIDAVLGADDGAKFRQAYHILPGGNFREEATGHTTGASIPCLALGDDISASLADEIRPKWQMLLNRLNDARRERVPPRTDTKVLTAWNGLMIGALASLYRVQSQMGPAAIGMVSIARDVAHFCFKEMRPEGRLLRRFADGEAAIPAFLDDYAYLADGLLDLYDATGEQWWRDAAASLANTMLAEFADPDGGGFFSTGTHHETLIARSKDSFDGALPSANGVAARVLYRLGAKARLDPNNYFDAAMSIIQGGSALMARAPQAVPTLVEIALECLSPRDRQHDEETGRLKTPAWLEDETRVLTLKPGESGTAIFVLRIAPDFHVNARIAGSTGLIPTTASFSTNAPVAAGPIQFPEAESWEDPEGTILPVYMGDSHFAVPVHVTDDAIDGLYELALTIKFQPCNETACLAPGEEKAHVLIRIASGE